MSLFGSKAILIFFPIFVHRLKHRLISFGSFCIILYLFLCIFLNLKVYEILTINWNVTWKKPNTFGAKYYHTLPCLDDLISMSNFTFNFSISHFQQIASVAHGTWIVCRRSFIFAKRPREVNVSLRNDAKPDKSSLCWNSYFVAGHLCTQLETVNFLFKTIFEIFQKVRWVSSQFFLLRLLEFNPSNAYFAVTSCTSGLNSGISELLTSDTAYLLCTSNIRSHTATFATLIAFKT